MLSTTILVAAAIMLLVLQVLVFVFSLRLGLRWAKISEVTTRRIVTAIACITVIQSLLAATLWGDSPDSSEAPLPLQLLLLVAAVLGPVLVISRVFKATIVRSFQAWLPVFGGLAMLSFLPGLVLRPFVFEAFVCSANSMAPTLLGKTYREPCPECGEPSYCSARVNQFASADPQDMICANFHVHRASEISENTYRADRFLVAKFLTPKRWDLVVFEFPGDPSQKYVKRLVGLPGETIHIEGGAVWADGVRLQPPEDLRGLNYVTETPNSGLDAHGTVERPAVLGSDEYFVLGDFSVASRDSRFWWEGADGHPPYAVPQSHMRGVVTYIYWPPARWRVLR